VLANAILPGETLTGAEPVPVRLTVCGLFVALSVNVKVPPTAPTVVGENVTPTVQEAPAAILAPQLLVATAKPALATILAKLRGTFSWFVRVTVLAALVLPTTTVARFRVLGEMLTGVIPVPVRLAVWGLLPALSVMVKVPVSGATMVGVNVTRMVQVAPPAKVFGLTGQVPPVLVKLPLTAILLIFRGVVCTFVSVSVFAALWVPSA
jgi:hypothetical protein